MDIEAQSLRKLIKNGNELYNTEKYSEAEIEYLKGIEKNKNEVYGYYNRGNSLYKQNKDSLAEREYLNSLTKTVNKEIKSKINYNVGNIALNNKNYEKAIENYKQSLKLNPNDEDTRHNLSYALQQMQLQKDSSGNKNQNKKENQKEEKKEDQNKQDQNKEEQKNKNQQQSKDEQKQEPQKQKSKITKENAEQILQAINKNEKDVQKNLKKRALIKLNVEKDW